MDISFDFENNKLNIRAAALIFHNNKLLVHKNVHDDYYALLGGRVKIGEDSQTTIRREILEELGKEIDINGYACTIENFFFMNNKKYHEYIFTYLAEFSDDSDKKITTTIKNVEGKNFLQYEWLDLEKIDQYTLKPTIIKEIIKENIFPTHKINIEL